jgi:hypothetical protein
VAGIANTTNNLLWWEKAGERNYLEELGVEERIKFKWMFKSNRMWDRGLCTGECG